jgi:hypothetical protein
MVSRRPVSPLSQVRWRGWQAITCQGAFPHPHALSHEGKGHGGARAYVSSSSGKARWDEEVLTACGAAAQREGDAGPAEERLGKGRGC